MTTPQLIEEVLDRVRLINLLDESSSSLTRWKDRSFGPFNSLFDGSDVADLLEKVDTLGSSDDPNALFWPEKHLRVQPHELDGAWATRWNGGNAKDQWKTGVAQLQVYGEYLYILTYEGKAHCLIATRRLSGNRLAGRYINLREPKEIFAWAGRIIDKDRIDGFWVHGRWDLRRK